MIDQMITLRTRLNERVAKSKAHGKFLEKMLVERDADLVRARTALRRAAMETETLRAMCGDLKAINAAGGSGMDEESKKRLDALYGRLDRMSKALKEDAENADGGCLREVSVNWAGNASDVRLMGSFDDWTRGFHLSPEFDGDLELGSFSCVCALPPGEYQVKFLVDGEWRTTEDWPTVGEGYERNMILSVT